MPSDPYSSLKEALASSTRGPDLWDDLGAPLLESRLVRARQQEEAPDWNVLNHSCLEHLSQSLDLRVLIVYALGQTTARGIFGFADTLSLIAEVLETDYDLCHPCPLSRDEISKIDALDSLAAPLGSDTHFEFIALLSKAPLATTASGRTLCLRDLKGGEPLSGQLVQGSLGGQSSQRCDLALQLFGSALSRVCATIESRMGAAWNPAPLKELLASFQQFLSPVSASTAVSVPAAAPAENTGLASGAASPAAPVSSVPVGIRNREDVVRSLVLLEEYYQLHEPSSPVILMLMRARRMVPMSFIDAINEMKPDSADDFKKLFGVQDPPSS